MGWEFEQAGTFGSEKKADEYVRRNNLDPRDVQITRKGDGVELNIRRSALDGHNLRDRGEGRRDGWGS